MRQLFIVNRLYKRLTYDKNREDGVLRSQRRALAVPELQQQNSLNQSQAALFAKLPLDVRLLIYECVLEDEAGVVHVLKKARKPLEFVRCSDECQMKYNYKCCGGKSRHCKTSPTGNSMIFVPGFLSLLQTCQRVYNEAIDILYDFYLFDFRSFDACILLSMTLPPQRWQAVRKIHLQWHFGQELQDRLMGYGQVNKPSWDKVWKLLSRKEGLHTLILDVHAYLENVTLSPAFEAEIFQPLNTVTVSSDFIIQVSWQPNMDSSNLQSPFQFRRLPER